MAEVIRADVAWRLARALAPEERNGQSQVGTATVTRVDADGTVWVRIPGSVIDTPANGTVTAAAEPGQTVGYRIESGRLSVTGNVSSPAVGGTYVARTVEPVERKADAAAEDAGRARVAADSAERDAMRAQEAADDAQADATRANAAASDALRELSTVQDVVGVVEWAQAHGEEAMAGFINSHLSLTTYGLNLVLDNTSYRIHIGTLTADGESGVYVIDGNGHVVATLGENIRFDAGHAQYIGNENAYVVFTPPSGDRPATVTIGGNVVMGGTGESLSDLLSGVRYDHWFEEVGGSYVFHATAHRGGIDVTADYDPDFYAWWLRTEDSETYLGSGTTMAVPSASAGYRASVLGGLLDVLAATIADDAGDGIVDEDGDEMVTHWVREG